MRYGYCFYVRVIKLLLRDSLHTTPSPRVFTVPVETKGWGGDLHGTGSTGVGRHMNRSARGNSARRTDGSVPPEPTREEEAVPDRSDRGGRSPTVKGNSDENRKRGDAVLPRTVCTVSATLTIVAFASLHSHDRTLSCDRMRSQLQTLLYLGRRAEWFTRSHRPFSRKEGFLYRVFVWFDCINWTRRRGRISINPLFSRQAPV